MWGLFLSLTLLSLLSLSLSQVKVCQLLGLRLEFDNNPQSSQLFDFPVFFGFASISNGFEGYWRQKRVSPGSRGLFSTIILFWSSWRISERVLTMTLQSIIIVINCWWFLHRVWCAHSTWVFCDCWVNKNNICWATPHLDFGRSGGVSVSQFFYCANFLSNIPMMAG